MSEDAHYRRENTYARNWGLKRGWCLLEGGIFLGAYNVRIGEIWDYVSSDCRILVCGEAIDPKNLTQFYCNTELPGLSKVFPSWRKYSHYSHYCSKMSESCSTNDLNRDRVVGKVSELKHFFIDCATFNI